MERRLGRPGFIYLFRYEACWMVLDQWLSNWGIVMPCLFPLKEPGNCSDVIAMITLLGLHFGAGGWWLTSACSSIQEGWGAMHTSLQGPLCVRKVFKNYCDPLALQALTAFL